MAKEEQKRVLNTPIAASVYDRANAARVVARKSWRELVEQALTEFLRKEAAR